jgi:sigma-B regulation protein RsbU (phosphoserine phosphatase)
MVTDRDGTIRYVNETLCGWTGREASEIVGRMRVSDLLTMGGRIFLQTHWMPLLQMQGSVSEVKLDVLHRDGHSIPMMLNAVARQHQGATVHEYGLFIAKDRHKYERELMIARKRAEELLEKEQAAQKLLALAQNEAERLRRLAEERAMFAEQMMAIVSHDLRNPMTVIRMSAHVIGLGDLSSNQHRALGRLVSSTARASRLIADLLDFSAARFGEGLRISRSPVDLHDAVADCLEDLRTAFPGRTLIHQHDGSRHCSANADRLAQLIGNLVANAMTYGAQDKPVVVRSVCGDAEFMLSVTNEGPDIPQHAIPTLFDAMTRGDKSPDGTHSVGLGLFIVREIARAHAGSVAVCSQAGVTTFTVTMRHGDGQPVPTPSRQ